MSLPALRLLAEGPGANVWGCHVHVVGSIKVDAAVEVVASVEPAVLSNLRRRKVALTVTGLVGQDILGSRGDDLLNPPAVVVHLDVHKRLAQKLGVGGHPGGTDWGGAGVEHLFGLSQEPVEEDRPRAGLSLAIAAVGAGPLVPLHDANTGAEGQGALREVAICGQGSQTDHLGDVVARLGEFRPGGHRAALGALLDDLEAHVSGGRGWSLGEVTGSDEI